MPPALSVVLPVRDAAPFVRDALRSLQSQTFEDYEVLIQDDGSEDGTQHIISDEFARWDERFQLEVGPPLQQLLLYIVQESSPCHCRSAKSDRAYRDPIASIAPTFSFLWA